MKFDQKNAIFVFGSNLAGIHGGGAARYAQQYKGAVMGAGVGRTGESYALPTKGLTRFKNRLSIGPTLALSVIQDYVEDFKRYAETNWGRQFQVTCVGCGLAGLRDEDVAPMFNGSPENCWFDEKWKHLLLPEHQTRIWGTF